MRGLLAGLVLAVMVLAVALVAASIGAVGVAAIGWLLAHWFELTQWQGTIVGLVTSTGLGYLVYRLAAQPETPAFWSGDGLHDDLVADCEAEQEPCSDLESPIVPWRRSRQKPARKP